MKAERFPITVKQGGVTARVHKVSQIKNGKRYTTYIADFYLLGKRRQVGRAKLEEARNIALDACRKVATGEQASLTLTNNDRMAYLRAKEALTPTGVALDTAAKEFAEAFILLSGRVSVVEACRDWVQRNETTLPRITVADAVEKLKEQSRVDRKSEARQKQLRIVLDRFAESFNVEVHTLTPKLISDYLAALPLSERSKRNHRDVIRFFDRWLILRGYLPKGASLLEGVQKYTARKLGEVNIYTPDEMRALLNNADKRLIPFLAIGAFAGLRHAEINRLDWSEIELAEGDDESFIEVRADKSKTETRRLVPVKPNLKAWLWPHRKTAGKVCPFTNTTKQLLKLARDAGMEWRHNGLRHSCVSYRVAESGDVARVADESGNSPQVIRGHYLRRVKPSAASQWFSIMPPGTAENILTMPTGQIAAA